MRFSRHRKQVEVIGLIIYVALLVGAVTSFFWEQTARYAAGQVRQAAMDAAEAARQHTGMIMIPHGYLGQCRHVIFDNITGSLSEGAVGPCRDDDPLSMTVEKRFNAMRESFLNR
jgi:hypothetical protein